MERFDVRKQALNYDFESLKNIYLNIDDSWVRQKFSELFRESYFSYLYGSPKSSILMAGEILLRVICYKINVVSKRELAEGYTDPIRFCKAIKTGANLYKWSKELVRKMNVVRLLRNVSVHSELPLLLDWDPEDPRQEEEFLKLLRGESEIPEAYEFVLNSEEVKFDLRNYPCNTMKSLNNNEKFAVIQLVTVFEIMKDL